MVKDAKKFKKYPSELRDLLKYLVGLISIILICVYSTRYFCNLNREKNISFLNINFKEIIKKHDIDKDVQVFRKSLEKLYLNKMFED